MDFMILRGASHGHAGERAVLVIHDEATEFVMAYPMASRSSEHVAASIRNFTNGSHDPSMIYSDGGPELIAACRQL
eukprot:2235658-Amphidinium_carterae.1